MERRAAFPLMVLLLLVLASLPFTVAGQTDQSGATLPPWRRELPAGRDTATIMVADTPLAVDLAVTGEEQSLGLGYRNGLEPGTGMLFVGTESRPKTFWMKGMRFCLDIVWVEDGQIVGAATDVCPDPPGTADVDRARFSSGVPVTHVLEVPAGWLEEHGYGPGTSVDLSEVPEIDVED